MTAVIVVSVNFDVEQDVREGFVGLQLDWDDEPEAFSAHSHVGLLTIPMNVLKQRVLAQREENTAVYQWSLGLPDNQVNLYLSFRVESLQSGPFG